CGAFAMIGRETTFGSRTAFVRYTVGRSRSARLGWLRSNAFRLHNKLVNRSRQNPCLRRMVRAHAKSLTILRCRATFVSSLERGVIHSPLRSIEKSSDCFVVTRREVV